MTGKLMPLQRSFCCWDIVVMLTSLFMIKHSPSRLCVDLYDSRATAVKDKRPRKENGPQAKQRRVFHGCKFIGSKAHFHIVPTHYSVT